MGCVKPGGSQLTTVSVHTLCRHRNQTHGRWSLKLSYCAGGYCTWPSHKMERTFMLDAPCSKGCLSVLAKERHGTYPSLQCVLWGFSAGSSWEHRNCHSACPSLRNNPQLPAAMQSLPAALYSLLSPTPIHSRLCIPLLLLQHLCQPQPWLWRKDLSMSVLCWHIHLQSHTQSWGPSCSPLSCASRHSCWLSQETKTDSDRAAWEQVLSNFTKASHNGWVLDKNHTFKLSQLSFNNLLFPLKDFGANSAYSVSRSNWEWIKYSGHEKQAKTGQWSKRCVCDHLPWQRQWRALWML